MEAKQDVKSLASIFEKKIQEQKEKTKPGKLVIPNVFGAKKAEPPVAKAAAEKKEPGKVNALTAMFERK
jgi:hypothetical protein